MQFDKLNESIIIDSQRKTYNVHYTNKVTTSQQRRLMKELFVYLLQNIDRFVSFSGTSLWTTYSNLMFLMVCSLALRGHSGSYQPSESGLMYDNNGGSVYFPTSFSFFR